MQTTGIGKGGTESIMKKSYVFYTDPGHGWLRVPHSHIKKLGLEYMITSFSYRNSTYAYLEEDSDMPLFTKTAQERGWVLWIERKNSNTSSKIRKMDKY